MQHRCLICRKIFHGRRDAEVCGGKCKSKLRQMNDKIMYPTLEHSGIPGITQARGRKSWQVRVKMSYGWKYIGSVKSIKDAIKLQSEVSDVN